MFCPKCATQNMDNARFCRACGADISLVPVALTGRRPETPAVLDEEEEETRASRRRRRRREKKPATYAKAFENLGVGAAFLIISLVVALAVPSGRFWWFWLLIPTFACFGEGIGQLIQLRRELPRGADAALSQAELSSSHTAGELPAPRNTSEMMAPPPSVTEGTTRHLSTKDRG
ncbi:MAG: zinc ribbon domain-containing protein [Pyrinomonadaceae bacterium]|nr:zinc ribbon domain-containing protein [Pyrinomonadaceae bacterium]